MTFRFALFVVYVCLITQWVEADQLPSVLSSNGRAFLMGPIAQTEDVLNQDKITFDTVNKKSSTSPRRAFLSSILLPGLGQFLAGNSMRGAIFSGIELAALGMYLNWNGKGKDTEDEFRKDAGEQWDPLAYRGWRGSTISRNSSITHALPCSSQVYKSLGNESESGGSLDFGDCASTEIQQYYELIGKYDQYVAGWEDLVRLPEENRAVWTEVDSVENFRSQMRLDYELKRDESNRYLKRASWMTGILLVNHIISAIDAARVARIKAQESTHSDVGLRTRFAMTMSNSNRVFYPMFIAYKPLK